MSELVFAATQMACDWSKSGNLDRAEQAVREAAGLGAQIILLQELFETPYFCKDEEEEHLLLARPAQNNPVLERFQTLAAELQVVLPISFFERSNNSFFNSMAMLDADGACLGVYRKSHIPDGPGYSEKYYFAPGNTGFRVWDTRYARLGVGICWDQWFPEAARAMALMGAEALLYPTAIGSEPHIADFDSRDHWQRVMQGHAGANLARGQCCATRAGDHCIQCLRALRRHDCGRCPLWRRGASKQITAKSFSAIPCWTPWVMLEIYWVPSLKIRSKNLKILYLDSLS